MERAGDAIDGQEPVAVAVVRAHARHQTVGDDGAAADDDELDGEQDARDERIAAAVDAEEDARYAEARAEEDVERAVLSPDFSHAHAASAHLGTEQVVPRKEARGDQRWERGVAALRFFGKPRVGGHAARSVAALRLFGKPRVGVHTLEQRIMHAA